MILYNFYTISPLDGRYINKIKKLKLIFSEASFIYNRIKIEIIWLKYLSNAGFKEIKPFSTETNKLLNNLIKKFNIYDLKKIKKIEFITKHDVKAIEYWIKKKINKTPELKKISEFIHFACTSDDINNSAYGVMLKNTKKNILLPIIKKIINKLTKISHKYSKISMISRTHGQLATPTTMGKEMSIFVYRLKKAFKNISKIKIYAKINGAVGNYNAHLLAYPKFNWLKFSKNIIINKLNLNFSEYTTQIESHDYISKLFDSIIRLNTILLNLNKDIWNYILLGYFKQTHKKKEIGSSTMPHKVNPINFENSEGNLGISNSLLKHFSEKLPISRFQRDLTDSTVLRNLGVAIGYSIIAYKNCLQGLKKIKINKININKDLLNSWICLAEPIQIIMKKYNIKNSYEKLKFFTRGKNITKEILHKFINKLPIPKKEKKKLFFLKPKKYIGYAIKFAKKI